MLTLENIHKHYEGQPLLEGISISVAPGETLCLLGPSGSGKSTLLRIIAGLESAEQGRVLWEGQDLAAVPAHRRRFGLVFQEYALFPNRDVWRNVAFGLEMQGLPQDEIDRRVAQALEQVGLQGFAQRRVDNLSGGEQQRVALARALAPGPHLLMFDEPLGALDFNLRGQLTVELRRLLQQAGIPAIYVTHDQEEAFAVGTRLALLHDGRIEQEGLPEEVMSCPATPWAARFLGLANLLPSTILQPQPLRVHSALGDWDLPAAGPCSRIWAAGDPATLLIRPNGAGMEKEQGTFPLRGRVEQVLFRGDHHRVELLTPQGCRLDFDLDEPLPQGSEARLWLRPEAIRCLPAEGGGP
jgi:ABC-type Fe3+/spermidine/putrescine transport system ATPase subunit